MIVQAQAVQVSHSSREHSMDPKVPPPLGSRLDMFIFVIIRYRLLPSL